MTPEKDPIQRLIDEFRKLPGIGPKSAQRLVFYLLKQPEDASFSLADSIRHLRDSLGLCSLCNNITDVDPCRVCSDPNRDSRMICVVQEPFNVISIEKSGGFKGLYHVLHGAISPIDGVGPEEIRLKSLLPRLADGTVQEVIIATNPTTEGEATALYIGKLISPLDIKVSRIASGIPVGGDIEYADGLTISRALSGRKQL
jgi:recombination protein RecR